jgi:hypothetical protein
LQLIRYRWHASKLSIGRLANKEIDLRFRMLRQHA